MAQEIIERTPPQNIEAETAVLGSMLLDREATSQAIEMLDPSAFYKDAHQKIYQAIVKLYDENKGVDIITVADELKRTNSLDAVGGPVSLATLASSVPTSANIAHYAKIVKDRMLLRKLITASTQVISECYNITQDVDSVLDKAEQTIFEVSSSKVRSRIAPLRELIKDSIETIDGLYQRKEHVTGIPTGFRDFDIRRQGCSPQT